MNILDALFPKRAPTVAEMRRSLIDDIKVFEPLTICERQEVYYLEHQASDDEVVKRYREAQLLARRYS